MDTITLFENCVSRECREVTWQEVYEMVHGDMLRTRTEAYRKLMAADDKQAMKNMKSMSFPALMPCCHCKDGVRQLKRISAYTGYCQVDFDHLTEEQVGEVWQRLKAVPEVLLMHRSMSGRGLHVYFRYTGGEYKRAFRQGNEYMARMAGADYDVALAPAVHLSCLCHDADAYFNPEAKAVEIEDGRFLLQQASLRAERNIESLRSRDRRNAAEVCRRLRALLERREQFTEGNRHNYLTKLLFLLSDYGVPESDAASFLQQEFPEYRDEDYGQLAQSCYRSVADSFGSKQLGHERRTNNCSKTKMERVAEFLAQQPLRYDVLSRKVQCGCATVQSSEFLVHSSWTSQMENGKPSNGKPSNCKCPDGVAQMVNGKWSNGQMRDVKWNELTDRMANALLHDCNRALGCDVSKATFMPMLLSAQIPEVNPLREYILSLPEWDGRTDYIAEVASMVKTKTLSPGPSPVMGREKTHTQPSLVGREYNVLPLDAEGVTPPSLPLELVRLQSAVGQEQRAGGESSLWYQCFKKWFVAMVAGWMSDEVVNHQVLVLIGEQGIYKTTWLDALMPPELAQYRCRQSGTRYLDKDEQLRATEFGLINMDEIDRMTEAELNALKSLITATEVNVRAPYAYGKERRLRVASYVASGNKEHFLTDQTSNRRWLPFHVERIESPFLHPLPYEGMYAQAWHLVQEGFNYWFDLDEIRQLSAHVEEFAVETNEQQLLPVYFEPCPAGTPGAQLLTVAEISAKLIMYGNIRHPMDVRQLGALLRRMGYEARRFGEGGRRGYIVMELSADAVNAKRRIMA